MAAMATISEHADDMSAAEPVSEWSIFWALVAIASHAMLQVSFTGYLWSGDTFQGSLWPHRSSPFICVVDCFAEIVMIFRNLRKPGTGDGDEKPQVGRNGSLTRLALFVLGVLPQAIKLFAMQGIPVTKAIAAMYLIPSVVGLAHSLITQSPEENVQEYLESFADNGFWSKDLLRVLSSICGWIPSLISTYLVVYGFVDRVGLSASDNVVNAVDWLSVIFSFGLVLHMFQHMVFVIFNKRSPVGYLPILFILLYTDLGSIPILVAFPGKKLERKTVGRWQITLQLVASICLASYLCASVLYYLADWLYSRCMVCGQRHWVPAVLRRRGGKPPCSSNRTQGIDLESEMAPETTELAHTVSSQASTAEPTQAQLPGSDTVAQQQRAAEEGAASTPAADSDRDGQNQDTSFPYMISRLHRIRQSGLRWFVWMPVLLFFSAAVSVGSLYIHAVRWSWWQVAERRPTKILANAFGFLNLSVAVLYYLIFFDAEGTSAPDWSEILG